MANNYTQFSFSLECSEEEHKSLESIVEMAKSLYDMEEHKRAQVISMHPEYEVFDYDYVTDLNIRRVSTNEKAYETIIYAEVCGQPFETGEVLKIWLARNRPSKAITFTYSETCSKMRPGEFSGGAVFVTAKDVVLKTADSFFSKEREDYGDEVLG